jgi:hypothetical protein
MTSMEGFGLEFGARRLPADGFFLPGPCLMVRDLNGFATLAWPTRDVTVDRFA